MKLPANGPSASKFKHRNSIRISQTVQRVINDSEIKQLQQRRHSLRNIFGLQGQQTNHVSGSGTIE